MKVLISVLILFAVNGANATAVKVWMQNLRGADNLYKLIKTDPVGFDRKYPSATLEEVDGSLQSLEGWLRWLQGELTADNLLFPGFLPKWDSVESDKKKLIQQIDVLNAKITKLQEKRNKFLEEIDDSLKSLKERLKRLKGELAKDNLLFPSFLPTWDSVESNKKKLIQEIAVLNAKINKLREKRKMFKPLRFMDKCQMGFQSFLSGT